MKSLRLILACLLFFNSVVRATEPTETCPSQWIDAVNAEIHSRVNGSWRLYRNRVRDQLEKLKPEILMQLEANCSEVCSPDQHLKAVTEAVDTVLQQQRETRGPGAKAYALFLGAVSVQAALTIVFTQYLDKVTAITLATLTNAVIQTFVSGLGAAVTERLSSLATSVSYAAKNKIRNMLEKYYERVALDSRAHLTTLAQGGRGLHRNAVAVTAIPVVLAILEQLSANAETGMPRAVRLLARLLFDVNRTYPELDLDHEEFRNWVQDGFGEEFITNVNYQTLFAQTLERLRVIDKDFERNEAIYRKAITAWLAPNARLGIR